MSLQMEAWWGKVMTVEGLIPAEAMGITLPHEHLVVQGWDYRERNYFNSAFMELVQFPAAGGRTIVDLTNIGRDRDPLFMKRLAARAGIQVIMGTGYYKDAWLPPEVHDMSVEDMAQVMVREIMEGVSWEGCAPGDTGIHAGVIGEMGVSRPMTRTEEKALLAAARAQRETGAAISVHFDLGTQAAEYHHALDILQSEGADLNRVAVDHLVPRPDNFELYTQLADRGCYLEFDLFGQEAWPLVRDMVQTHPEVQISSVKGFIDQGLLERILLSQDVCHILNMTVNGGHGYAHILNDVVPRFKEYGITDREVHTMMVDNPKRLFPFHPSP
jgi:phosphotriesterase-related protein